MYGGGHDTCSLPVSLLAAAAGTAQPLSSERVSCFRQKVCERNHKLSWHTTDAAPLIPSAVRSRSVRGWPHRSRTMSARRNPIAACPQPDRGPTAAGRTRRGQG